MAESGIGTSGEGFLALPFFVSGFGLADGTRRGEGLAWEPALAGLPHTGAGSGRSQAMRMSSRAAGLEEEFQSVAMKGVISCYHIAINC